MKINRSTMIAKHRRLVLLLLPLAFACGEGAEVVQPPPADSASNGGGGDDDGTVQRATLTLEVIVDPADMAVAHAIGWDDAVASAEVTIVRSGGTDAPLTATTDANGVVEFGELLPGTFSISVLRSLTSEERAALASEDADVTAFGGGDRIYVDAPAQEGTVRVVAGRRGTLVFGEIFGGWVSTGGGNQYNLGHFVEVVNNGDATIYLDGKIVGVGIPWVFESSFQTCEEFEQWRIDPEGVWTGFRYKFPGSGRNHPLQPGEVAVIATDAIDHSEVAPGLDDLRGADFEFVGSSDVDNPTVPNMINMGPREWAPHRGHGHYFGGPMSLALAGAVEEEDLVIDMLPVTDPEHRRLPADKILDVFTSDITPGQRAALGTPTCPEFVHPRFDRGFATLVDIRSLESIQRAVFATTPDGRVILQRTRTSARDFVSTFRSPGLMP